MPPAAREQWQRERLAEVLDHARRQVPFYREVLQPGGTDLSSIPSIDKEQIKADETAFYAANRAEIPSIDKKTGGSTGVPFAYSLDRRAWAHQYAAAIHLRERVGFRYGEPVVLLGAPTSLGLDSPNFKSRLRHRLERHHQDLTGFAIDADASAERVRRADAVGRGPLVRLREHDRGDGPDRPRPRDRGPRPQGDHHDGGDAPAGVA